MGIATGTCPFCHQKAGILSREHPERRWTRRPGRNETAHLAAQAAASHTFDEKSLRPCGNSNIVNQNPQQIRK